MVTSEYTSRIGEITAIATFWRRPKSVWPLVNSLRAQSVRAAAVWGFANEPDDEMQRVLRHAGLDRLVSSSENTFFHARFALALVAPTPYVAIFDDDAIPGPDWLANCLETSDRLERGDIQAILGTAGVRLHGPGYADRTMHGWQQPAEEPVEVDLVGQAWFLRTDWVKHLFAAPVRANNGEDIELAARAWRIAGIRGFCPPHPAGDTGRWGSTRGFELGLDEAAASRREEHLAERERIVRAEIQAGWEPLFMRGGDAGAGNRGARGEGRGVSNGEANGKPASAACESLSTHSFPSLPTPHSSLRTHSQLPTHSDVRGTLDLTHLGTDPEEIRRGLSDCAWNSVDCGSALVETAEPDKLLNLLRRHLLPGSTLRCRVRNVRHHERISALISGQWPEVGPDGALHPINPVLRHFTRRELEKLFYRHRFAPPRFDAIPNPPLARWRRMGRPLSIDAGGIRATLSTPDEAEEFFVEEYGVNATAIERPARVLTSIVIVAWNQFSFTRDCLQSILHLTDEPYEIVLVDNGSRDGTGEYIRALEVRMRAAGPNAPRLTLITNPENRGFPAAANQGIAASQGEQILLLNNDVLVTTGWLARMLDAFNSDPRIGLLGPCSNCVSGLQEVQPGYSDLESLDGFSWEWGKKHAGLREDTNRLVGFCLLVRRALIEQIGNLDERFGIGNFEDDDLCRRAIQAGWRCVIARDAYIHHFGHKSFEAAGMDLNAILRENKRKFDEKWGESVDRSSVDRGAWTVDREEEQKIPPPPFVCTASSVVTRPSPLAPRPSSIITASPRHRVSASSDHPSPLSIRLAPGGGLLLERSNVRLSLCMIVRDNASTIVDCLLSARPWVDEMVVVDTGSRDGTPDIARRLGARVFTFPWCDDFSAARNESLRHARGEWLFWMDSDDVIDEANGRGLRRLVYPEPIDPIFGPEVLGFVMKVRCPAADSVGRMNFTVVDHPKLFRNLPELRFEHRIHEQILGSIRRAGGDVVFTDIFIVHAGADHSPSGRQRKLERDLKLLELDLRDHPNHTFVLFNLGMTYLDVGRYEEAASVLERSIASAAPHESHIRKAYALLADAHRSCGQPSNAWAACQEGRTHYPKDPELLFREGLLAHQMGRLAEAEQSLLGALANDDEEHFSSIDEGIIGYKARHNLALVNTDMGRLDRAEEHWQAVVIEVPAFCDGWKGLGDNLVRQRKWGEARNLADMLLNRLLPNEGLPSAQCRCKCGRRDSTGCSTGCRCGDSPCLGGCTAAPEPWTAELRELGFVLAARVCHAQGDWMSAQEQLNRGEAEYPDSVELLRMRCEMFYDHGSPTETERFLLRLIQREPEDPAAHHNLGTTYLRLRRHGAAESAFRQIAASSPGVRAYVAALGVCAVRAREARRGDRRLAAEPGT